MSLSANSSSDSEAGSPRLILGSVSLYSGVGLLGLLLIDSAYGLPFPLPRSWYVDRPIWSGLSFLMLGVSWVLLRNRQPTATKWQPTRPGLRFNQVTVYTRTNCHLCDDAKQLLETYLEYLPTIEEVDVDADPVLKSKFDTCVPVVEIDSQIRFRGKVDEVLLRRLIEGSAPLE